jgi:hypothetical protein
MLRRPHVVIVRRGDDFGKRHATRWHAAGQASPLQTVPSAVIRGIHVVGHDLYVSVAFGNATPFVPSGYCGRGALRALTIRPT